MQIKAAAVRPVGTFAANEVLTKLYGSDFAPKQPLLCKSFCLRFNTGQCHCKTLPNTGCGEFDSGVLTSEQLDSKIEQVTGVLFSDWPKSKAA